MDRRTFLASTLAAAACLTPAQAQTEALSSGRLQEDIRLLERAWNAMHPGLYRYNTPAQIERMFEAARHWAGRERSLGEAFVQFTRLSAALKCGHTFPNPANQGRRLRETLLDTTRRLPFAMRWIDGDMIVTHAMPDAGLVRGDRVLKIDGVSASTLRRRLLPLMRADGSSDAKRLRLLSIDPADDTGVFDLYRALVFGANESVLLDIERGGTRIGRRAALVSADARLAAFAQPQDNEGWSFAIEGGIGRLTMPDWALYDSQFAWRAFIDASVDALIAEDAQGLIVDLRSNEGGLDCGDVLLERLIAEPIQPQLARRLTRYRRAPAELDASLDTWDPSFKDWGDAAVGPDAEGFYELVRGDEVDGPINPRGPRFEGRLIVLTDASNSSATFQFAQKIKDDGLGTLVGETTGGNQRGINGGAFFFFRLPNSRVEVDLPLIGYFPTTAQPDAGIIPDVSAAPSRRDVLDERDSALEAARALLSA